MPDFTLIAIALCSATVGQASHWPNPETDPLMFIANPVESQVPGHWVPLSVLKEILKKGTTAPPLEERTTIEKKKPGKLPRTHKPHIHDKNVKKDDDKESSEYSETGEESSEEAESSSESRSESTQESSEQETDNSETTQEETTQEETTQEETSQEATSQEETTQEETTQEETSEEASSQQATSEEVSSHQATSEEESTQQSSSKEQPEDAPMPPPKKKKGPNHEDNPFVLKLK